MASTSPLPIERRLVRIASTGRVDVAAEERDEVEVRGDADVTLAGNTTTITAGSGRLSIKVPVGVDLVIGSTSGRVAVAGHVGELSVVTESGRVVIEQAQSADVRSKSGRVDIGQSDGDCRVRSQSGKVSVASCQRANVATESGSISLRDVSGEVRAHCTSGRIDIEMATANDIDAETVTGRITVSFPSEIRAFHTEIAADQPAPSNADCTVFARSVTGRVDVGNR